MILMENPLVIRRHVCIKPGIWHGKIFKNLSDCALSKYLAMYPTVQVTNESDQQIHHYSDVVMGAMASQITSLTIVY